MALAILKTVESFMRSVCGKKFKKKKKKQNKPINIPMQAQINEKSHSYSILEKFTSGCMIRNIVFPIMINGLQWFALSLRLFGI